MQIDGYLSPILEIMFISFLYMSVRRVFMCTRHYWYKLVWIITFAQSNPVFEDFSNLLFNHALDIY